MKMKSLTPLEKYIRGDKPIEKVSYRDLKAYGGELAWYLACTGEMPTWMMSPPVLEIKCREKKIAFILAFYDRIPNELLSDPKVLDIEDTEGGQSGWYVRDSVAHIIGDRNSVPEDYHKKVLLALFRKSIAPHQLTDLQLAAATDDGWTVAHSIASWRVMAPAWQDQERLKPFFRRILVSPAWSWVDGQGRTVKDVYEKGVKLPRV